MGEWEIWGLLLLVGGSFAATNLDNLVLLVLLLGAEAQNRFAVLLGFVAAAIGILCVAAVGAAIGASLDPGLIGYMGIIPLLLGAYLLFKLLRGDRAAPERETAGPGTAGGMGLLGTTLLMFSNSGDSLAIFFPLLAESDRDSLLMEVSAFLVMVLLWAALAWKIAAQPALARRIEQLGEKLVPFIMMAAGIYILMDTGTDTLK